MKHHYVSFKNFPYSEQMTSGDRQSDGQWSRTLDIGSIVIISGRAEHNQNQYEGDQELDAESLFNLIAFLYCQGI